MQRGPDSATAATRGSSWVEWQAPTGRLRVSCRIAWGMHLPAHLVRWLRWFHCATACWTLLRQGLSGVFPRPSAAFCICICFLHHDVICMIAHAMIPHCQCLEGTPSCRDWREAARSCDATHVACLHQLAVRPSASVSHESIWYRKPRYDDIRTRHA